jgi:hypothetical protein
MTDARRLVAAGSLVAMPHRTRRRDWRGPLLILVLSLALWGLLAWLVGALL